MTTNRKNQDSNKAPDFIAFFVPEQKNARWTRFGAAWQHKDGEGFNIEHDFLPTGNGRIVLRSLESVQNNQEEEN